MFVFPSELASHLLTQCRSSVASESSASRIEPDEAVPADIVPPGLLLDDVPQQLLLRFASLSARARQQCEDELARRLDHAALLAVATWLRSQHGAIPLRSIPARPCAPEPLQGGH
ncbi:hypothetical protein M446_6906 [Methylobacterium sp. 4-46]|nr:hypothetical protein M446_6906 [Methylobacterium sp. 4-46]